VSVVAPRVAFHAPAHKAAGRIGPNAILQTHAELIHILGEAGAARLLHDAGLGWAVSSPPTTMVDEVDVRRLFLVVEASVQEWPDVLHAAGRRTAAYVLEHRIPRPAHLLLQHLPPRPAARLLLRAIQRNAWTFMGSGRFSASVDQAGAHLEIRACPLCRNVMHTAPRCHFYTGAFEGLFAHLVSPAVRVHEMRCEATGDSQCAWEVTWQT
jgi:divinyl protochlorophyllide a 8-vinyl-reductase